jgi:hypothetical protein
MAKQHSVFACIEKGGKFAMEPKGKWTKEMRSDCKIGKAIGINDAMRNMCFFARRHRYQYPQCFVIGYRRGQEMIQRKGISYE